MWYAKNLPAWERIVRLAVGIGVLAWGVIEWSTVPLAWLIAGGGIVFALTGTVGFCPMCAMAGRKIATKRDRTLP